MPQVWASIRESKSDAHLWRAARPRSPLLRSRADRARAVRPRRHRLARDRLRHHSPGEDTHRVPGPYVVRAGHAAETMARRARGSRAPSRAHAVPHDRDVLADEPRAYVS